MDPLEAVDRLARHARGDEAPAVDVIASVLRRIRSASRRRGLAPLSVFSLASALAAGVTFALGVYYYCWLAASNPMDALLPGLQVVSLW